jgi:predicted nucleotide-binding protein
LERDYKGIQDGINTLLSLVERLTYDAEPDPVQPETRLPRVAKLKVSRADAENILGKHFNEGEALRAETANDDTVLVREEEEYNKWRLDQKRWNERTKAALRHVYADDDAADEFYSYAEPPSFIGGYDAWQQNFESDYEDVGKALNVLRSLTERLQYDDAPEPSPTAAPQSSSDGNKDPVVFIVHGHDTGFRETVARWLEKEGPSDLEVVILDEQPDRGRTVLEKLEDHADESVYTVVLFTGDDIGAVKGSEDVRPRARQNVVFEFGWFCGLIGRENVGVIFSPDVELPSDLNGLVYIPVSDWEKRLRRELKASGLAF